MTTIRTRFAPSPTGFVHVGAVRTALFAWLLAKQNGGQFILRIEDTDKVREVEGSEQHIMQSLKWLGLDWDEGPDRGGTFAPYRQSERLDIYKEWAVKLIEKGRAYADPYTKEELEAFRDQARANKQPFLYRNHRPVNPPAWDGSQPLRLKSEPKKYSWSDAVMGEMHAGEESIDDIILIKADGYPTYNFAHIVDDALMQITHVIRSQEFIASLPNYFNLYEALDVPSPVCVIVPYVMAIDGKKKLSKRDGAKDILDYQKDGILPEAMMNFLATLGWNDGSEQEIFSREELIEKFSLERVQKSPARFDEQRLLWLNGQWIRRIELAELYKRSKDFWPEVAKNSDETYKKQILGLMQDRLKTLSDLRDTEYFFAEPKPDMSLIENNKQLSTLTPERRAELLRIAREALEKSEFSPEAIQETLNKLLETTGEKPGTLFSLIRIYLTWAPFSPELNRTIALMGENTILKRLS
jgi:glutamyl-tRNA synthetase